MFQMYGSVWVNVFPYCLLNVLIATSIKLPLMYGLMSSYEIDDSGHALMGIMVAFLVVTRGSISLGGYDFCTKTFDDALRSCREICQHATAFTRYDRSDAAIAWRFEVCRRSISLINVLVAYLQYDVSSIDPWDVEGLYDDERKAMKKLLEGQNERSPELMTMFLRSTILSHTEILQKPLDPMREDKLLANITEYVTSYIGIVRFNNHPLPFPLAQMTRTLIIIWVYSIPFFLAPSVEIAPLIFFIIILTYSFVGMELVSDEMHDPFGDDPNDLEVVDLAKHAIEDIQLTLLDVDGQSSLERLKQPLTGTSHSYSSVILMEASHETMFNEYSRS